jgi:integrase
MVPSIRVLPKDWQNGRIKHNLKNEAYNYHVEYNLILDEIEAKLNRLYRQSLLSGKKLSKNDILDCIDDNTPTTVEIDFFSALDEFVQTHISVRAKSTITKYKSCIEFIKDFENYERFGLGFETINKQFLESFRDYAFLKRDTMNNYYSKLIAFIKTFMNWALDRGYHNNVEFRKFKRMEDDIEVIYLTMDELLTLYNHDFESRRLSNVRDIYCFGCFTGLRFSDLNNMRMANIYEDHIRLTIKKSKTTGHIIPLNKWAKEILEKYKGTIYEPLPRISGQKFNEYIKECCEDVGLNELTTISRFIGQKRIDRTVPKSQLITSHTARKTFVTNSLILGMNERVLKNITGHKDDASFKKYLKIAEDFKQIEMNKAWDKI